jgi:hypothetical protein
MKPHSIGRVLGTGFRVAGRIAGQRVAAASQPSAQTAPDPRFAEQAHAAGRATGHTTGGVARGLAGFLRPFQRVGSKIWLEVMGAFYLLFALAFTRFAVQHHPAGIQGPYDRNFLLATGIVLVFAYLGATSFWRASRK